ncbi:MAG: AgmX/PglI C-terminal domain-containing protein [Pseudobdellovibrionaceae bacterium]
MAKLLLKQIHSDGRNKSWILRDKEKKYTFGQSKFCEIISIDEEHEQVMGFFEFNSSSWYYVDLSQDSIKSKETRTKINSDLNMELLRTTFEIKVVLEKEKLFRKIQDLNNNQTIIPEKSKTKKLVIKLSNGLILESKIVPMQTKIELDDDLEIIEKEITLVEDEHIRRGSFDGLIDKDSIQIFGSSFLLGLLIMVLTLLFAQPTPKPEPFALRKIESAPIILKTITPKEKKQERQVASIQAEPTPDETQMKKASKGGGSKSARTSITEGRISQLIGKISASSQRSKNVIITTGVVAGTQESGRGLAMIGKVDKAGKDWGKESLDPSVTVSTAGMGGKKSLSQFGSLRQGSTGQAGIGLIEDEIEVAGGLDRDVIAQYIKSQLGYILYCYERQLSAKPSLQGKVSVKFTIGGDGQVNTQKVSDTTMGDPTVEGCMLSKIAKWKFPSPKGGTQVNVTYPFLFKSTN